MKIGLPNLSWVTEVNGLGKAYRDLLKIPRYMYLPFYSYHGFCQLGYLEDHELESQPLMHITWNRFRYDSLKEKYNVVLYPCPLIPYWRKKYKDRRTKKNGTLIFIPHTNFGYEHEYDVVGYIKSIIENKIFEPPFNVCVHPTDNIKGLTKYLIKSQVLPEDSFVTLGNQLNYDYADEMYLLFSKYKYGVSSLPGTELFLMYELGGIYMIYGDAPVKKANNYNIQEKFKKIASDNVCTQLRNEIESLFSVGSYLIAGNETKRKTLFDNCMMGGGHDYKSLNLTALYVTSSYRYIKEISKRIYEKTINN
jgi:hypothetical protein